MVHLKVPQLSRCLQCTLKWRYLNAPSRYLKASSKCLEGASRWEYKVPQFQGTLKIRYLQGTFKVPVDVPGTFRYLQVHQGTFKMKVPWKSRCLRWKSNISQGTLNQGTLEPRCIEVPWGILRCYLCLEVPWNDMYLEVPWENTASRYLLCTLRYLGLIIHQGTLGT